MFFSLFCKDVVPIWFGSQLSGRVLSPLAIYNVYFVDSRLFD